MKCRGLLLDRDGVINIDRGYLGKREQFTFLSGLFPFLRVAQDKGYKLAILTNQSGVARGIYTERDYADITTAMLAELSKQGIAIDLVLQCFEHPEGTVFCYARESFWRKPNPGMVLEAIQKLRLDPQHSIFLGDQVRDMHAAQAGGIGTCILLNESPDIRKIAPTDVMLAKNFDEVLEKI